MLGPFRLVASLFMRKNGDWMRALKVRLYIPGKTQLLHDNAPHEVPCETAMHSIHGLIVSSSIPTVKDAQGALFCVK